MTKTSTPQASAKLISALLMTSSLALQPFLVNGGVALLASAIRYPDGVAEELVRAWPEPVLSAKAAAQGVVRPVVARGEPAAAVHEAVRA
jgi:hypothetical protein